MSGGRISQRWVPANLLSESLTADFFRGGVGGGGWNGLCCYEISNRLSI